MKTFLESWLEVAKVLFAQALAGQPQLTDAPQTPAPKDTFGFAATLTGDPAGRFSVFFDAAILASPLLGEGTDQKGAWAELLREVAESACGDLLVRTGQQCRVAHFEPVAREDRAARAFQLSALDHVWRVEIHDQVAAPHDESILRPHPGTSGPAHPPPASSSLPAGVELLLDVELAASLRFGSREMPLAEVLDLGPGDVVQLDRHVADPVDLIVGDKIVARGEVVLVNGNFGLRVTEVAEPRSRLESIRCLF